MKQSERIAALEAELARLKVEVAVLRAERVLPVLPYVAPQPWVYPCSPQPWWINPWVNYSSSSAGQIDTYEPGAPGTVTING